MKVKHIITKKNMLLLLIFSIFGALETVDAQDRKLWGNSLVFHPDSVILASMLSDDAANITLSAKDDKFGTPAWDQITSIVDVQNRLIIDVIPDLRSFDLEEGDYYIDAKVEFWQAEDDPNGPPCQECTKFEHLVIGFYPNTQLIIRKPYKQYQNAHKIKVTILGTSDLATMPTTKISVSTYVSRSWN